MPRLSTIEFVFFAIIAVTQATPPTWNTAASPHTLDSTVSTACNEVTELTAAATDGSALTYTIASQSSDGGFSTDQNGNGDDILTCSLATILAATTVTEYTVVVSVTQAGNGESANLTLTITVKGLSPTNNNDPVFIGTPYNVTIYKDKIVTSDYHEGSPLTAVNVTDADGDAVTISISTTDTPFSMSGFDIQIANKTALGLIASPYEFVLLATDNGSPQRSSSTTVTITLVEGSNGDTLLSSLFLIFTMLIAVFTLT